MNLIRFCSKSKDDVRFMSLWAGRAAPGELIEILVEKSLGYWRGLVGAVINASIC